jgi:capsular polysaccharide biosynthesis protein
LEKRCFDNKGKIIFHSLDIDKNYQEILDYQKDFLQLIGIERKRIKIIVNKPCLLLYGKVLDEKVILNTEFKENSLYIYDKVRESAKPKKASKPENIFLSRPINTQFNLRVDKNSIKTLEDFFSRLKFKIEYPETLKISEQIQIAYSAKILAGFSGSMLHLAAFGDKDLILVEFGDSRSPMKMNSNQKALCDAKNIKYLFIPYVNGEYSLENAEAKINSMIKSYT